MKFNLRNAVQVLCFAVRLVVLGNVAYGSALNTPQIESGKKAKVKGTIAARSGDILKVNDKKTGTAVLVSISGNTTIERKKGTFKFRRSDMDIAAMVPGLGIEAEGVGDAKGRLVASKITFSPDDFAIEVAEEQQILANQAAAQKAQSTANQGVSGAQAAQSSANQAQSSANRRSSIGQSSGCGCWNSWRHWSDGCGRHLEGKSAGIRSGRLYRCGRGWNLLSTRTSLPSTMRPKPTSAISPMSPRPPAVT